MFVSTDPARRNVCNLTIDTALDQANATPPGDDDAMAPISATEKWQENLGRIEAANDAEADARAALEKCQKDAWRARVNNGKAVRRVCRELSDSEDCHVIRDYDPFSIYRRGSQMVVTEDGIRILRLGFSWDTVRRPTWFQRRDTELFDPADIEARLHAAAAAIRRGEDPAIEYHRN